MGKFINLKENLLVETEQILEKGNLEIHPAVAKISLEGSRGLQGNFRDDSDLDLSLILKPEVMAGEALCEEVLRHSLESWQADVELDLAVVFDKKKCGLKCFRVNEYDPGLCPCGVDCLGVYKNQKGFSGFIPDMGLEVKNMYPVLIIWEN